MTDKKWLSSMLTALTHAQIDYQLVTLAGKDGLILQPDDWSKFSHVAQKFNARLSGLWGDMLAQTAKVFALYNIEQQYLLVTTALTAPFELASISTCYPAANRLERHAQDLLGISFIDSPDNRRWTRHQAWKEKEYPLSEQFPLVPEAQRYTEGDFKYPFFQTQGASVCEVPVGPIHAGIIEPGHFRFQIIGETVLNLEQRLGYTHKGIEKLAVGKSPSQLLKLAARVSGDSAVAHAWSASMAMEQASQINVPERALYLRAILLERERVANHIGDIGAICNDVGFAFAHHQTARLRELWQRTNLKVFGHRLLMDTLSFGGVTKDLNTEQVSQLLEQLELITEDFNQLIDIIQDYPSLEDRLATTGILPHETAKALGCLGYVGRASGVDFDVRRDAPHPPYTKYLVPHVLHHTGDVLARVQVRVEEVRSSFKLLNLLLHGLVSGAIETHSVAQANTLGLGIVAGWRGETTSFIRFDNNGLIARYFPRDPSWLNWPALEALIDNNIIADFPVCNKSVNGSYSGVDL